jgi:N-acetylmuramoyl-L-alanine amidase
VFQKIACILVFSLNLLIINSIAYGSSVKDIKFIDSTNISKLTIILNKKSSYNIFTLTGPSRLVIDIKDAAWDVRYVPKVRFASRVRHAAREDKNLRIVFDLNTNISLKNHFIRGKDGNFVIEVELVTASKPEVKKQMKENEIEHKLTQKAKPKPAQLPIPQEKNSPITKPSIIKKDLPELKLQPKVKTLPLPKIEEPIKTPSVKPIEEIKKPIVEPKLEVEVKKVLPIEIEEEILPKEIEIEPKEEVPSKRITDITDKIKKYKQAVTNAISPGPVIIIDAGHGGDDPGTIGSLLGIYEKEVTLQFAKYLKQNLEEGNKYRVHLIRDADIYMSLSERVQKARKLKGDLFISLHADSNSDLTLRGVSIYTLSETASDREAAALAIQENKSDYIKDSVQVKEEHDDEVTDILIDLVQRETKNLSAEFAEELVTEFKKNANVLKNAHRFAGFKVLKGVNVPAVLIELGYLSNSEEEKLLSSPIYRKKIITGITKAIDIYFSKQKKSKKLLG